MPDFVVLFSLAGRSGGVGAVQRELRQLAEVGVVRALLSITAEASILATAIRVHP